MSSRRAGVLRRPAEFEAVLRSGIRVSSRNFVGRAARRTPSDTGTTGSSARLGLIAGKKAAARAVDRNRAKRLVREIFRAEASAFSKTAASASATTAANALGPFDVTIQLRSDLRSHNNESVRTELRGLLASLARRCRSSAGAAANPAAEPPPAAPHRQQ